MGKPKSLQIMTDLYARKQAAGNGALHTADLASQQVSSDEMTEQIKMTLAGIEAKTRHAGQLHQGSPVGTASLQDLEPIRDVLEFPILADEPLMDLTQGYALYNVNLEHVDFASPGATNTFAMTGPLYLFHVLVALEWRPSALTIKTLMHGLRGASDFLYDATNGCMAFGQVTFCGRDYMTNADIQVMASNRFHPRSMVDGFHKEKKFFPVRVGRGIWHKNNRILIPWDEPIGFRVIAHEWAHYALGLHDEYIDQAREVVEGAKCPNRLIDKQQNNSHGNTGGQVLVVPRIRLSIESMMATLDVSEIVPLQYSASSSKLQQDLRRLLQQFIGSDETASLVRGKLSAINAGPHHFPGPLPQFYRTKDFAYGGGCSEEVLLDVNTMNDADGNTLDHCWLYTLQRQNDVLKGIIAQGTIDARARRFDNQGLEHAILNAGQRLLSATTEHKDAYEVLAIGRNTNGVVINCQPLTKSEDFAIGAETDRTPRASIASAPASVEHPPVVAVLPSLNRLEWPEVKVSVHVVSQKVLTNGWIAVPGATPNRITLSPQDGVFFSTETDDVKHLDGLVVLEWGCGKQKTLWVAEYSHGGNPPTSVRHPSSPLSAGSADGNLMIFCRDEGSTPKDAAYETRIVTTRNYGGFERQNPGEPCSYLFSVAANQPLDIERLHPTIVLYYDGEAFNEDTMLFIFRYEHLRGWQPVPTYLPPGAFYAATPLNLRSAPNLVIDPPPGGVRVEYYRLFAIPRP